jgi:hypothetical protein
MPHEAVVQTIAASLQTLPLSSDFHYRKVSDIIMKIRTIAIFKIFTA